MSPIFENLSWMDLEKYLEKDNRIVVTIGSCEQHGYLSLLTDTLIATKLAEEACNKEGIVMTPPLPFGISSAFLGFPGTISLKPSTFNLIVQEVLENLIKQGFQRILLNNGHGGNIGQLEWIKDDFNNRYSNVRISTFSWWNHPRVIEECTKLNLELNHANWAENFIFTRVGPVPEGLKNNLAEWPRAASSADYKAFFGDGSFGGPYQTSDQVMDQLFAAAVEAKQCN